ncbi:polysaccharide deacetylase family protein [Cytobacillus kochii]|uniref:polysaccharide deacetylase family protein n=1 Tax=Cytobacillus kochii TaxID=859143 RepID=UPI001CD39E84|nr:polysaccharide deacetylase family protein [Cytobacillus kochii]MCA1025781.1 polysaccharide deacetylase family protein [Cytobacillus kochii]
MALYIKRNDTHDVIQYKIEGMDLTGATTRFFMEHIKSGKVVSNANAEIVDAKNGLIQYTLTETDTVLAGTHRAEFEVVFDDGKFKTYPSKGYIRLELEANINKDKSTHIEEKVALHVSEISVFKQEVNKVLDEKLKVVLEAKRGYSKGYLIENFSNFTEWNLQGGTAKEIDSVNVKSSKSSIKLIADGVPTFIRTTRAFDFKGTKMFKLSIYVDNPSAVNKISLYLANDTTYENFFMKVIKGTGLNKGWNEILIDTAHMSATGAPSLDNKVQSIQVRIDPTTGMNASLTFDALIRDEKQRPKIIFTMDDNWISQYTEAYRIMREKGFRGTIAVIPTKVGEANYMNLSQLQDIYNSDWDLVNHTNTHIRLGDSTRKVQESELSITTQWLDNNGFTKASDIVVYPYGSFNDDTIDIIKNIYRAGRSIVDQIETTPPLDITKAKVRNLTQSITAQQAKDWIDEAIATGGTVIFLNHRFGDEVDSMFFGVSKFQELVDYAFERKSDIDVVTYSEWLDSFGG